MTKPPSERTGSAEQFTPAAHGTHAPPMRGRYDAPSHAADGRAQVQPGPTGAATMHTYIMTRVIQHTTLGARARAATGAATMRFEASDASRAARGAPQMGWQGPGGIGGDEGYAWLRVCVCLCLRDGSGAGLGGCTLHTLLVGKTLAHEHAAAARAGRPVSGA